MNLNLHISTRLCQKELQISLSIHLCGFFSNKINIQSWKFKLTLFAVESLAADVTRRLCNYVSLNLIYSSTFTWDTFCNWQLSWGGSSGCATTITCWTTDHTFLSSSLDNTLARPPRSRPIRPTSIRGRSGKVLRTLRSNPQHSSSCLVGLDRVVWQGAHALQCKWVWFIRDKFYMNCV